MRSYQFQKITKKLIPFAIMLGILIVFFYNFTVSSADYILSGESSEGILAQSKGNFLSELIFALGFSNGFARNILFAGCMLLAAVLLLAYAEAGKNYVYFFSVALLLSASRGIFAQTYASVQGAAVAILPSALLISYLSSVCDLFRYKGKKSVWKIPFFFLWGLAISFFDEGIAVATVLLSLLMAIMLIKNHGLSYHLIAHFLGSLGGVCISLAVPGSRQSMTDSFYVFLEQLSTALDALFVYNWLVIGALALACLLLIQPIRQERSKNCNKTLFLLFCSIFLFLAFRFAGTVLQLHPMIGYCLTIVKALAAAMYLWAVARTMQHYVSKDYITQRVRNDIFTVIIFVLVFALCGKATQEMLFLPFVVIVASTISIYVYAARRYRFLDSSMSKYFTALAIVICGLMCIVNVSNAMTVDVIERHATEQISAGETQVTAPALPFSAYGDPAFTVGSELTGDYGTVSFVPYERWDWDAYWEVHNVPVIEEYDAEKDNMEDMSFFEED